MRMYKDGETTVITGDEALLAKIEGAELSNVIVPETLARPDADNVMKAYDIAVSKPHTSNGKKGDDEVVYVNGNVKVYALVKKKFVDSLTK